jgi:transposase
MEYREHQPTGYQYSQFCELYARWAAKSAVTMRQVHRAGEKGFVDFSGDGIDIVDPQTGECTLAKLFVAVLGASNLTYVEPALSEDLPTWIGCHVRAFAYFGGVPEITVPDNLRSGVKRPDYYDPEINPTYAELAAHYGTAVIPARVRKPRDKAKVEQGVLIAERWILAVLRNRLFHSIEELAAAVKPLVEKINDRPMQRLKKSRRQLFEEIERAALRPLPAAPYEFASWKTVRVHIDYHVEFERHYYSVPYELCGEQLDVRATEATIEILDGRHRVASHPRSFVAYGYTTNPEHMPKAHQNRGEWTPERLLEWAKKVGPSTGELIREILVRAKHPEQGFKSCLGVMALRRSFPDERIERACARAVRYRSYSRKSLLAILKNNLDRVQEPAPEENAQRELPLHGNTRGGRYYH